MTDFETLPVGTATELATLRAEVAHLTLALGAINGAMGETVARFDAAKAGAVRVKPGLIEREIWKAMVWAAKHPPPPGDACPPYTDSGNSNAEVECRQRAARILAALD